MGLLIRGEGCGHNSGRRALIDRLNFAEVQNAHGRVLASSM
jgi:hypothetical protein